MWKKVEDRKNESGAWYENERGDYIEQNLDAVDRLPGSAMTSSYRYIVNSYEATINTKDDNVLLQKTFYVSDQMKPAKCLQLAKKWCDDH
jgi:hypothetical protein